MENQVTLSMGTQLCSKAKSATVKKKKSGFFWWMNLTSSHYHAEELTWPPDSPGSPGHLATWPPDHLAHLASHAVAKVLLLSLLHSAPLCLGVSVLLVENKIIISCIPRSRTYFVMKSVLSQCA